MVSAGLKGWGGGKAGHRFLPLPSFWLGAPSPSLSSTLSLPFCPFPPLSYPTSFPYLLRKSS